MALGSDKAPVTVIEYASIVPARTVTFFSETTFPELKKRYIDTGKVRYIFREFPFDKLAAAGFMLARCASKNGGSEKFMAVVETLFAKQNEWVVPDNPVAPLSNIAKQLGFTGQFVQSLFDRVGRSSTASRRYATGRSRSSASIPRRHSSSTARRSRATRPSRSWPRKSIRISRTDKGFSALLAAARAAGRNPRPRRLAGKSG